MGPSSRAALSGRFIAIFRVIEVPFTFKHDRAKMQKVLRSLTPTFNRGFEQNGFKNFGFFEIGKSLFGFHQEGREFTASAGN